MDTRKKQTSVYCTDEENDILRAGAKKAGLSFCSFLRNAGMEKANKIMEVSN